MKALQGPVEPQEEPVQSHLDFLRNDDEGPYDLSDDDDEYDWYTITRALSRVDTPTACLLRTAAFALHAAVDASIVTKEWGGVFGAELVAAVMDAPATPAPSSPVTPPRERASAVALPTSVFAHPTSLAELRMLCKGPGVSVVDFGASWCGPCQQIAPVFDALVESCPHCFAKVDVDDLPDASAHYSVSALQTFLVFKDGAEVSRVEGADEDGLMQALGGVGYFLSGAPRDNAPAAGIGV